MAELNEHQLRLWNVMVTLCEEYVRGDIGFSQLVQGLQGTLEAGEFHDQSLIKRWHDFWTPLEIHNADRLDKGEPVVKEEVMKYVEAMRQFLISELEERTV